MSRNVPLNQENSSDCSHSGENSKDLFLRLKSKNNSNVSLVPPSSLENKCGNNKLNSRPAESSNKEKCIYRNNNRAGNGNKGNIPDARFRSPEFREAVRLTLESLGLESNFGNFKKYDRRYNGQGWGIDWHEFCCRLKHPHHVADVYVLDSAGERIPTADVSNFVFSPDPVHLVMGYELIGSTPEAALRTLDTKRYEFKEWN